jgi:ABC-2 type transport system ATP-binding protein
MTTTTTTGPAIVARGLRKSFGTQAVLGGIDLEVPAGSVFSLLGPNGAGKTTAVKILSTLIRADAGEVRVAGHDVARDPDAVRAMIGVTGQFSAVDGLLTGRENLVLMADLHHVGRAEGRRRAGELLDRFDLTAAAGRTAATYSGGMRRRLDLAMSLVGRPRIIFLDEPTTGLDPRSRRTMWQIIRDLRFADPAGLDAAASAFGGDPGAGVVRDDEALTLQVPGDSGFGSLRRLLDRLDGAGVEPEELSVHTPDLDDVFLALTGTLEVAPR